MDGLTSGESGAAPVPPFTVMLGRHIKPDGWGSLALQGWSLLLVEAAGSFCSLF